MHRRNFLRAGLTGLAMAPLLRTAFAGQDLHATSLTSADAQRRIAAIEARVNGRLGVAVRDVSGRRQLVYRGNERFPMCSTFKWLLAGMVLARVDAGEESLARAVTYGPEDLLEYAPRTRERVAEGAMSVGALCAAAIQWSDNTAANLLLETVGGPQSLTVWLRSIGDAVTRLDRTEGALNSAIPGDPRDTTTPAAMAADMQLLLLGDVLSAASRCQLCDWLRGSQTGDNSLRAGLPEAWPAGNKTGSGQNGTRNDVAIAWPTPDTPLLVAGYLTGSDAAPEARDAALADVARTAAAWLVSRR